MTLAGKIICGALRLRSSWGFTLCVQWTGEDMGYVSSRSTRDSCFGWEVQ